MTGRELIIYILENGLEDTPVYEDGRIMGMMTEGEAAEKFGVGVAVLKAWVKEGMLSGITIGQEVYIPKNAKNPKDFIHWRRECIRRDSYV